MHPILAKTFGGLSRPYYLRHLLFALIFPVFLFLVLHQGNKEIPFHFYLYLLVNTLLYPYARYVYENIVDFIMGNNVFLVNMFFMMIMKAITMLICWSLAIFIAPLGLIYLYIQHSKLEKNSSAS